MPQSLPSAPSSDTSPTPQGRIARQAILNVDQAVFGYELFDRSVSPNQHSAASDAQLLFNMLSSADAQSLGTCKTLFLNCTHDSLAGGYLDLIAPERAVLEIPAMPTSEMDQIETRLAGLQDVKRRGFRMAFDYSVLTQPYESWLPLASFIKLDLSLLKPDVLSSFVRLAQQNSHAQLIAEKVETAAQHQLLSDLGVKLFQGFWFARPIIVPGQAVRPAQANILQLINLVRKQASTNDIEDLLKRDPTLSFNLLRFINSAGFGARSEVTSFKHAVMLLGLNRLFKWAALLLTSAKAGDTPPAVGTTAVVRGRLMELLATETLPAEDWDNAFVVGVFSMLDTMLGISMAEAMATLTLPDAVTHALLHQSGPLAPLLALTIACEVGDDAAFTIAIQGLGLSNNQVNWAHLQALAWAETLSRDAA